MISMGRDRYSIITYEGGKRAWEEEEEVVVMMEEEKEEAIHSSSLSMFCDDR